MDDFIIYQLFKQIILSIDNNYTIRFRDIKTNKHNEVGIFVKGGEVDATKRLLNNARYTRHFARVQVIIQSGDNENSVFRSLNLKHKLKEAIESTYNKKYIVNCPVDIDGNGEIEYSDKENEIQVLIIKTDLLGEADFKGYTSQGLPRDTINFKIEYTIGG